MSRREAELRAEAERVLREAELIHDEGAVQAALDRLAGEIRADLADRDVLALCVMTGGLMMAAEVLRRLGWPVLLDYVHATRYRGRTTGDALHWLREPMHCLRDREVLILDDILDEGHTLAALVEYCRARGAARVRSAVLVRKRLEGRAPVVEADYVGLEVPDRYVFGYGMDYKEQLRNLPAIYAVREEG
jgi:hypoxanthine phosphoribosyltransferase